MKASKLLFSAILAAAYAASLLSCASKPASIPDDMSAPSIVQRAQEASDDYDYKVALAYYQALKERYGSDPAYLCAAEYEMSFIAYKQGRIVEAKAGFQELLARYSQPGAEALPQRYRILAVKVLDNIEAQEKGKK